MLVFDTVAGIFLSTHLVLHLISHLFLNMEGVRGCYLLSLLKLKTTYYALGVALNLGDSENAKKTLQNPQRASVRGAGGK